MIDSTERISKPSTRRTTRASTSKPTAFLPGDVVEVAYYNGIAKGRLLRKVLDAPYPSARWLVTYDAENLSDEVCCEKNFSFLLARDGKTEENPPALTEEEYRDRSSSIGSASETAAEAENSNAVHVDVDGTSSATSASSGGGGYRVKKGRKNQGNDSKLPKSVSVTLSAREQRKMKRDAMKGDDNSYGGSSTCSASSANNNKRKRQHTANSATRIEKSRPASKKNGASDDEVVEEIELNTGTLYIHKGPKRRVEFVWRH